jgi:hypothetical protein
MRPTILRHVAVCGLLAIVLAGCQTPEQSLMSAEDTCVASGYRPGTRTYNRCVQTAYRDYRLESQAASNAVAAGAAAGLIGGAVVAASTGPYYGSGVYVGPGYYGPYYGGYYGGYYRPYRPYHRGWGRYRGW